VSRTPEDARPHALVGMHPIARVSLSQVVGLVEALDEVGGEADVASIAQEVEMDLDRIGPIVDAAELLGLLTVNEGDLRVTSLSRKVLQANVRERKAIFRDILQEVPIFRQITEMVRNAGRPVDRKDVLAALAAQVGARQSEDLLRALVYWGRYVELVQYDSNSEAFSLRQPRS